MMKKGKAAHPFLAFLLLLDSRGREVVEKLLSKEQKKSYAR